MEGAASEDDLSGEGMEIEDGGETGEEAPRLVSGGVARLVEEGDGRGEIVEGEGEAEVAEGRLLEGDERGGTGRGGGGSGSEVGSESQLEGGVGVGGGEGEEVSEVGRGEVVEGREDASTGGDVLEA